LSGVALGKLAWHKHGIGQSFAEKQDAFVVAALNGKAEALGRMLALGVNITYVIEPDSGLVVLTAISVGFTAARSQFGIKFRSSVFLAKTIQSD
jgi:hypothetical protein